MSWECFLHSQVKSNLVGRIQFDEFNAELRAEQYSVAELIEAWANLVPGNVLRATEMYGYGGW
jgi:hypothetical protein